MSLAVERVLLLQTYLKHDGFPNTKKKKNPSLPTAILPFKWEK